MSSQSQITANRLNARKSTGPKTPQGKAVVSQNAFKHGLSARYDVITLESQADFDLHRDSLLAELAPQTPMESMLADRIVSLSWRLKRVDLIQNQTIDVLTEKDATNPLAKLAKSLGLSGLPIPQPDPADSNPDLTLGRIALKDFSNARVLDRLLMYERRIEHSLYKTILELQRLRLLRSLNSSDQISNSNQPESAAPRLAVVGTTTHSPQIPPPHKTKSDIRHTTYACPVGKMRKTNPIPKAPYSPQPPMPQRLTRINRPSPRKKTNPNKPNSHYISSTKTKKTPPRHPRP